MRRLYDDTIIYEVDDTITIRDWDGMVKEFGDEQHPGITIGMPFAFAEGMLKYCGEKATVISVFFSEDYECLGYKLKFQKSTRMNRYIFSKEMFVETYTEPICAIRDKLMKGEFDETLI